MRILTFTFFIFILVLHISCDPPTNNTPSEICETYGENAIDYARILHKQTPEEILHVSDSLIKGYDTISCHKAKMYAYFCRANYWMRKRDFTNCTRTMDTVLYWSQLHGDDAATKDMYAKKATFFTMGKMKDSADYYFNKAIAHTCGDASVNKCNSANAALYINYAIHLKSSGDIEKAKWYLYRGDSLSSKRFNGDKDDSLILNVIHNTLGNLHSRAKLNKEALKSYRLAEKYISKKNKNNIASITYNIAKQQRKLGQLDSARTGFNHILTMNIPDKYMILSYMGLGDLAFDEEKFSEAKEFYNSALDKSLEIKNIEYEIISRGLLAKVLTSQEKHKEALLQINDVKQSYEVYKYNDLNNKGAMIELELQNLLSIHNRNRERNTLDTLLKWQKEIYNEDQASAILNLESKLNDRLLKDSIYIYKLENQNNKLTVKTQRRGLYLLGILGISLLFGLYKLSERFKIKQSENTVLQFSNVELKEYNSQLNSKIEILKSKETEEQPISIASINKTLYIKPSDIVYVKAEYNGTRVYLQDKNYWSKNTLKNILQKLAPKSFIQIHRSTIVNLRYIGLVNSTYLQLSDGSEHNIGRAYKKHLVESLREEE